MPEPQAAAPRHSVHVALCDGHVFEKTYVTEDEARAVVLAIRNAIKRQELVDLTPFDHEDGVQLIIPWFSVSMIRMSRVENAAPDPVERLSPWSE